MGQMVASGEISLGRFSGHSAAEHDTRSIAHVHGSYYTNAQTGGNDDNSDVSLHAFTRNHQYTKDHVHSYNTGVPNWTNTGTEIRFSDFFGTISGTNTRWSDTSTHTLSGTSLFTVNEEDIYGKHVWTQTTMEGEWDHTNERLKVVFKDREYNGSSGTTSQVNSSTNYYYVTGGKSAGGDDRWSYITSAAMNIQIDNATAQITRQLTDGTAVIRVHYITNSHNIGSSGGTTLKSWGPSSSQTYTGQDYNSGYKTIDDYHGHKFTMAITCSVNAGSAQDVDNVKVATFTLGSGGFIEYTIRITSERVSTYKRIRMPYISSSCPRIHAYSKTAGFGSKG